MGTTSGHCPHCGFVPPSAPVLPDRVTSFEPAIWFAALVAVAAIAALLFVTN
jgi:hypothetical protein